MTTNPRALAVDKPLDDVRLEAAAQIYFASIKEPSVDIYWARALFLQAEFHDGLALLAEARKQTCADELAAALKGLDSVLCTNENTKETRMTARKALIAARAALAKHQEISK